MAQAVLGPLLIRAVEPNEVLVNGYEDVAPMPVIITESGGQVADLHGASVREGDMPVLVTNGRLHEELPQLVNSLPHSRDYRALDDGE